MFGKLKNKLKEWTKKISEVEENEEEIEEIVEEVKEKPTKEKKKKEAKAPKEKSKKVKKKIEQSGLQKKQIPLKVLVPILEHSSLEEDSDLQDKWANMLANAISGNKKISPNYVAILSELSSVEVGLLDKLHNEASQIPDYDKRKNLQFGRENICKILSIEVQVADLIIENLIRLGLCQSPAGSGISVGNYKFALRTTEIFEMTSLGYEFVSVCKW